MSIKSLEEMVFNSLPMNEEKKKVLTRRINKIKREPKDFIKSSYKKRSKQLISKMPIKYSSKNNFTVVSAVYNVDKYLDDYFKSLVNQSISFKRHIQLILVDDGSTDSSAEIIKRWQKKYPKNIKYFYKENGGQSSARNLGLDYIKTEWVTFIDPDDFVDNNYFKFIDDSLSYNIGIKMLVTNLKFYFENKSIVKDTHPLKFRFKEKTALEVKSLDNNINLSASSTFFELNEIKKNNLLFDSRVKPNFEDGKFIADYLLNLSEEKMVFVEEAVYFYRKREDGTSTLDSSWEKEEKFKDVFIYGFIPMLEEYQENFGFVPKNIQKTVLYDMNWYLQYLIDKPEKISFLSDQRRELFYKLFLDVFKYIDKETILSFFMAGAWFFQKVGMLGAFKGDKPPFQIVYIEDIDQDKKEVLISFFVYFDDYVSYKVDDNDTIPSHHKKIDRNFNETLFVHEVYSWIPYENHTNKLDVFINGEKSRISLKGKQFFDGLTVQSIIQSFKPSQKYTSDGSWLLMDRETRADDNAEHLYRYVMKNYPEQQCYFALRKDSTDWYRLYQEGFKLVEFGTQDFEYRLRKASKIISSHLEKHINNYFGDQYEYSKKFVFLQHGITQNNISVWFNSKKNLHCVISSTKPEYQCFVENNGLYKLTEKEVVLTGFPRHDNLLKNNLQDSKVILVMPTWRNNIVGEMVGSGSNTRTMNKMFMQTDYAKHWFHLLHSKELKNLAETYKYQILFAPHANIAPYLPLFEVPNYIDTWQASTSTISIQQLFQQAKIMITDYSSVAFEMGLLNKTVLYYQFDQKEIFSGSHTIQRGYFSYAKDGFGPVVTEEKALFVELNNILANDGAPLEPYATRIENTFAYRDTNNCQRVYEAIINLDRPNDQKINVGLLYDMTLSAYHNKAWDLAESRSELLIKHGDEEQKMWAEDVLIESFFYQNKFTELFESIEIKGKTVDVQIYWRAKVACATANYQEVIKLLESKSALNNELMLMLLFSYGEVGQVFEFDKLKEEVQNIELTPVQFIMIQAWSLCLYDEWEKIILLLEIELPNFSVQELREYLPQILVAKAYRNLSKFAEAHQQLSDFENHTTNNSMCRIEIAKLSFARDNYGKCINQYELTVNGDINLLPEAAIWQYVLSHWSMDHFEELVTILPEIIVLHPKNMDFKLLFIRALAEQSQWKAILDKASLLNKEQYADVIHPVTLAKYRLGHIDEAYKNSIKPTNQHSYEYWSMIAEIALLVEDFELAKYCYKGMVAIYPNFDKRSSLKNIELIRNNYERK